MRDEINVRAREREGVRATNPLEPGKRGQCNFLVVQTSADFQTCRNVAPTPIPPKDQASPVGMIAAVSTMRITARSGARVR